jgi:hypothetical protein
VGGALELGEGTGDLFDLLVGSVHLLGDRRSLLIEAADGLLLLLLELTDVSLHLGPFAGGDPTPGHPCARGQGDGADEVAPHGGET